MKIEFSVFKNFLKGQERRTKMGIGVWTHFFKKISTGLGGTLAIFRGREPRKILKNQFF